MSRIRQKVCYHCSMELYGTISVDASYDENRTSIRYHRCVSNGNSVLLYFGVGLVSQRSQPVRYRRVV